MDMPQACYGNQSIKLQTQKCNDFIDDRENASKRYYHADGGFISDRLLVLL